MGRTTLGPCMLISEGLSTQGLRADTMGSLKTKKDLLDISAQYNHLPLNNSCSRLRFSTALLSFLDRFLALGKYSHVFMLGALVLCVGMEVT